MRETDGTDGRAPRHARTPEPETGPAAGPLTASGPAPSASTGDPRPSGTLPTPGGAPDDDASQLVARTLDPLADDGWTLLHDLPWPDRPHAVIDHVAVGPAGIVVVASRHGTMTSRLLRESGYGRSAAVERVAQAAAAITATLPPRHRSAVRAVLCAPTGPIPVVINGVPVVAPHRLPELLHVLPPRLSPFGVRDALRVVRTASSSGGRRPWWSLGWETADEADGTDQPGGDATA